MYLFRFRDLVADTLREHREVIRQHGACWWGWWKRPSEDERSDAWGEIASTATPDTPVAVGLFDSGRGDVFQAKVIGSISPTPGAADAVPVPDDEVELIPQYYRDSPYSRAWLKISDISIDPVAFFDRFSFAEPPRLPNFTVAALNQLRDKVIISPDELRAMDTTIWSVRERRDGDSETQIIVSPPGVHSAISNQPVHCANNFILHITDPHFATGANRARHIWRLESERSGATSLATAITRALTAADIKKKIGVVVVTGDLTFTGEPSEFNEARLSLTRLLGNLNLTTDHLVVVPGNHDIRWSTDEQFKEDSLVNQAPAIAQQNYKDFYQQLFRHDPDPGLGMGRRYILPCGLTLEIVALNSSSLEQGKDFLAGMGRIDDGNFGEVANTLGWPFKETLALRVVALHHHLALTEDVEPASGYIKGFGIATDAPRILRKAAGYGTHLALHGHKHRAFVWRSGVYNLPEFAETEYYLGEISIVGGGTAGSDDREANSNFFNVIESSATNLTLSMFRSRNSNQFEPMARWLGAFSMGESGLNLSDWKKG